MKEDELLELAKLYESERSKLEDLDESVPKLKRQLDEAREWEDYVWCYDCNKRHRYGTKVAQSHRTVRIPKRCLTKYDHIFRFVGTRQESLNRELLMKATKRWAEKIGMSEENLLEMCARGQDMEDSIQRIERIQILECMTCGEKTEKWQNRSPGIDRLLKMMKEEDNEKP